MTVTAPVKVADVQLVMVKSLILTEVPVIAPPVPASRPRSKELAPSVIPAPKIMFWPVTESCVVATVEPAVSVTPPVPKFTTPPLVMSAPRLDAAPPVKVKPPSNANVSVVASPRVTRPVLRNSTFCAKVFPVPVMDTE